MQPTFCLREQAIISANRVKKQISTSENREKASFFFIERGRNSTRLNFI
jgi:hypothetical protein